MEISNQKNGQKFPVRENGIPYFNNALSEFYSNNGQFKF